MLKSIRWYKTSINKSKHRGVSLLTKDYSQNQNSHEHTQQHDLRITVVRRPRRPIRGQGGVALLWLVNQRWDNTGTLHDLWSQQKEQQGFVDNDRLCPCTRPCFSLTVGEDQRDEFVAKMHCGREQAYLKFASLASVPNSPWKHKPNMQVWTETWQASGPVEWDVAL